jgi:prepilin-type processing-associated H-X9-DG protein
MKPANTFTKKDVVVALVCFTFLLANLAAIGEGGRMRAKEAVCLSNLHKWGQIFQAYTADNDGFFHAREVGTALGYSRMWPYVYKPYYNDKMMRFCPTAVNPQSNAGTFGVWNYNIGSFYPLPNLPMPGEREYDPATGTTRNGFFTGSYGFNRFVENMKGGIFTTDPSYWRRADVKNGDKVPVLLDCMYFYFWDTTNGAAEPPAYDGDFTPPEIHWICINRHNGFINVCFLDFSARKVGLKELWTLKHNRTYNTCGPWTICGFGGNQQACAAAWDAAAPWMKDFPEY